jgi:hypothetical protein
LSRRTLPPRRRSVLTGVLSILLGLCAGVPSRSLSWANESSDSDAKKPVSITLDCTGRTSAEKGFPSFATGGEAKFTVTATFGEGATLALINPETSAVVKPLYDAETTIGHLTFGGGEEATIVWTRMSGVEGALMGEAIMSDGDVLALTVDPTLQETMQRPFSLFAAVSASLFRGTCATAAHR